MRSVAKHSYIKGASGKARAKAHVNYIQYRRGEDREDGKPREFFSQDKDHIQGREVKQDIDRGERAMVVAHKLILSPGLQNVDMQAYTRDVLKEAGREKGLDLDWRAVIHQNTDHDHAHVVVFGKDKNGRQVKFDREDYKKMREAGDRYLERNHYHERFLQRDSDRVMQKGYERDRGDNVFETLLKDLNKNELERESDKKPYQAKEWDKEKAIERLPAEEKIKREAETYTKYSKLEDLKDLAERLEKGEGDRLPKEEYQKLYQWIGTKERGGDDHYEKKARKNWDKKEKQKEKKKERVPGEDEREFKKLDKDLKKAFKELEGGQDLGRKGYKQYLRESQGRLGDEHGHATTAREVQRLKDLAERFPERREDIERQIEEAKSFDRDQRTPDSKWQRFDELLGENWNKGERDRNQDRGESREAGQSREQAAPTTDRQATVERQSTAEQMQQSEASSRVHDQMAGDKTQEIGRDDSDRLFEQGGR